MKTSDPRLEEEIAVIVFSFQISLNLHTSNSISDETIICHYREIFARLHLIKKLFYDLKKRIVLAFQTPLRPLAKGLTIRGTVAMT